MNEFSRFRQDVEVRRIEANEPIVIQFEEAGYEDRLNSFFSGLYAELVAGDVPYQEKKVYADIVTKKLIKPKTLFRKPVYETTVHKIKPENRDFWLIHEIIGSDSHRGSPGIKGERLIMLSTGELELFAEQAFERSLETSDSLIIFKWLEDKAKKSRGQSNRALYSETISFLEPGICKLLNI